MELAHILNEKVAKSAYELRGFINGLASREEVVIGLLSFDLAVVEHEDEKVRATKIIKGASVRVVREIEESHPYILLYEPTKQRYITQSGSRGGIFYDDGDSQTHYDHFLLERISSLDGLLQTYSGLHVPNNLITARLRVNQEIDFTSGGDHDYVSARRGSLTVDGELDPLFEKICTYIRGTQDL